MREDKLKAAVLGLKEGGRVLLEAASGSDYFQIEAVADKDTKLVEKVAAEYKCSAYDDYRQLVIQSRLDCLLVAAGLYSCDEHIRAAIKKKVNILKLAPMARNFDEAAELVRLAEEENVKFAVANPSRFAASFLAFREFLKQGRVDKIFLLTATCSFGHQSHPAWHTDPKLAGGGVLLRNCYAVIDQIVWNFATPQQVYSLNTNLAGDRQQRLYLTEDTAVMTLKFSDAFIGNLIASKAFGPKREFLQVFGKDKILTVTDAGFTVSDSAGQVEEEQQGDDDEFSRVRKLLENFALSILWPDNNRLCSSGRENLSNMAVIESAYLSARTGMPEEPRRIVDMSPTEPTGVWPVRRR